MLDLFFTIIGPCVAIFSIFCFLKAFYHRSKARSNFKEGKDSFLLGEEVLLFRNLFNETGKYHRKKFFLSLAGFVVPLATLSAVVLVLELHFGISL